MIWLEWIVRKDRVSTSTGIISGKRGIISAACQMVRQTVESHGMDEGMIENMKTVLAHEVRHTSRERKRPTASIDLEMVLDRSADGRVRSGSIRGIYNMGIDPEDDPDRMERVTDIGKREMSKHDWELFIKARRVKKKRQGRVF